MFSYVKLDGESKFEPRKTNKLLKNISKGSPTNNYLKVRERSSTSIFMFLAYFNCFQYPEPLS